MKKILPIESGLEGLWRHYKGGVYRVLFVAHHSETLEDMVVYAPIDLSTGYWVRPRTMWEEEVTRSDGSVVPRFSRVEE